VQADFWHERWRSGKIGFHQNAVAPALQKYWSRLNLPRGCAVFVPLCGKSLDMLWLRDHVHSVVGIELSDVALESFCVENGILARRADADGFHEYQAASLRLLCGDFFGLTLPTLGSVQAIYDRAALVAWSPELRIRYVEHLNQLTPQGCQTLLITIEYPETEIAGPPFSVDAECVNRLYSAQHEVQRLYREDILATDPKLPARGVTQLYESCYHLTRL
jgi:thiopurine S-methyltransferase